MSRVYVLQQKKVNFYFKNIILNKMDKLRNTTLIFLIKKTQTNQITDICLAMKKRGFGINRFNGVGGKVQAEIETIEEGAIREAKEEIGVSVCNLNKVAELSFYFPHEPGFNQKVHVYFSNDWIDEPTESEEMNPFWFPVEQIPYSQMWPDDIFWLPQVLQNKLIKASFTFGEKDIILKNKINIITNF